jgi:hypothetical protein
MFFLTFCAAVSLHMFSHWHPQEPGADQSTSEHQSATSEPSPADTSGEHGHETNADAPEASLANSAATASPSGHGKEHPISRLRVGSGVAALGLVSLSLVIYWWRRGQLYGERSHDARALAEGLRVQFSWSLAGLDQSVSANYMNRQRSELDWIRGAIRAVSFPYEQWRDDFAKLPASLKLKLLRCVRDGWLEVQLNYFDDQYHKNHHKLHRLHKFGGVFALAGVFSYVLWIRYSFSAGGLDYLKEHRHALWNWGWVLLVLAVLIRAACWLWQLKLGDPHEREQARKMWKELFNSFRPKKQAAGRNCILHWVEYGRQLAVAAWVLFTEVVSQLVQTCQHQSHGPCGSHRQRCLRLVNFLAHLLPAISFGLGAVWLCCSLPIWFQTFPKTDALGSILAGALFLSGGLSIAWAEKTLFSELAYQYNTMAGLFRTAVSRMDSELMELERLLPTADSEKDTLFDQEVKRVQDFLAAVGKEALDENAEWLLLHRARPLEPVMAG